MGRAYRAPGHVVSRLVAGAPHTSTTDSRAAADTRRSPAEAKPSTGPGRGGRVGRALRAESGQSPPRQGPASEGARDRTRTSNDASRAVVTGVTGEKSGISRDVHQRQPEGGRSGRRDG